jgi:hypothetical protein
VAEAASHLSRLKLRPAPSLSEVKLKTGGVLKIAYVSDDRTRATWHPDGSPTPPEDVATFKDLKLGSAGPPSGSNPLYSFWFEISDLRWKPGDNDSVVYRVKGQAAAQYVMGMGNYRDGRAIKWIGGRFRRELPRSIWIARWPRSLLRRWREGRSETAKWI